MIDYFVAEADLDQSLPCRFGETSCFEWLEIDFVPRYNNIQIVSKYTGNYGGLYISILSYNKIRIENSLHKFYKGNNYSDFTRSEINTAIELICEKFEIEANCWKLKKLEFGFNILVPHPAKSNLPLFHSFKGKEFQNVMSKNECYERKCFLTEYAVKVYDKREQVKTQDKIDIGENMLRMEVCYNQKRKLPKGIITLEDLRKEESFKLLFYDFIKTVNEIVIRDELDLKGLNQEERMLFFASLNSDFLKNEEILNKTGIKATKAKIRQIRERCLKKEFKGLLIKSLNYRYINLFCS